jgi:transposase-like protein
MARRRIEKTRADELLDELLEDYQGPEAILGKDGLLKQLSKRLVERALQAELSHHLEQEHQQNLEPKSETAEDEAVRNSRNGYSAKTIQGDLGQLPLQVPRDRQSTFEPVLVPKGQRRLAGLEEKVIALYARGSSTRDIQAQLQELYGVEISATLISQVTDVVIEEVRQWQARPLEALYPIVWLDALVVKVREHNRVCNKAVYLALGVNLEGNKELLGIWLSQTEGAKFWLGILTELKNRGLQDILIACVDGLTGFPEAIEVVYPQTQVQLCIVHLVRNSLKYVPWKQQREVAAELKSIYQASTVEQAEDALTAFAHKWDERYPSISRLWLRHWERIIPFFAYPADIRRVVYTTNAIESLNRSLRKVLKTKGSFPDDDAVLKLLYLALRNIAKKWTMPIKDWKAALNRFAVEFPDRFPH